VKRIYLVSSDHALNKIGSVNGNLGMPAQGEKPTYVITNPTHQRNLLLTAQQNKAMGSTAPPAPIPNQAKSKNLRACLLCSIIQTPIDFRRNGCPNCEDIMQVNKPQTNLPLPDQLKNNTLLDERLA